ncbi:heptaprenyl diphosphate synthase component 1 [Lihuaxuella thermophila]|uniref:Heptaprenyl diphosphate synthase (HEPPP synthase) subunit 1 n=1 Tax=Lihuaxuella thermophila TaxID=1173111 RepID=A0A1H8F865_9BACL|nr:heptaprenyl diphosphate synthase component 1 [Lihuaxuella thermophila]SEN27872.1 Heptaprenyl diphosphate synthase (HEPPP synthase) subunit 1 [Lihuaxuella thermophila]
MTSIHTQFNEIIDHIDQLARHSYVEQTLGKPPVPVFFVRILYLLMRSCGVSDERIRVYCTAATLLQMGLDTHDLVSLEPVQSAEEKRRRQLHVLIGDYYSSLFYVILSKHREIDGIQCLAKATSTINETKMTHHREQMKAGWNLNVHALKRMQVISGGLLTALADFFHVGNQPENVWQKIIPGFILFDLLKRYSSILHPDGELGKWVEHTWNELNQAIPEIEQTDVREELTEILNRQLPYLNGFSRVKER